MTALAYDLQMHGEFFTKFGGVFVEVFEIIYGWIWEVFGGNIEENYTDKYRRKKTENHIRCYRILFKIASTNIFNE